MAWIAVVVLVISIALSCGDLALAQGHISAEAGSDVFLPCLFKEPITDDEIITWERKLANGSSAQILTFEKKPTPKLPNIEWAGDLSWGDASIKISAVRMEDAGDYSCETFNSEDILSITLSVASKVVEAPSRTNNNDRGETTTGTIVAVVALLLIAVVVVGFVIAKRRRSRENESGTPPSTELQDLALMMASTA